MSGQDMASVWALALHSGGQHVIAWRQMQGLGEHVARLSAIEVMGTDSFL